MLLKDRFRPQVHFTPQANWMNDPNGCLYHNGLYHLFYQYHPGSTQWGPMHWGHATSRDLLSWEHQPIALYPDPELGMAFSGSAIHDQANDSGLFTDEQGLVAFYTTHLERGDGLKPLQQQCLAYSQDQGTTWTPHPANPVVTNPGYDDFRDPKVFYHQESEHWIMVVVAGQQVNFYRSRDLLTWTACGQFGKFQGHDEVVWECPDLMLLTDDAGQAHWVLFISCVASKENPFPPMQYFVGYFDGATFIETEPSEQIKVIDFGLDFYAAQSFHGTVEQDGRRIWVGWMNHWGYSNTTPADAWRGMMSLPRELSLVSQQGRTTLRQQVVSEFEQKLSEPVSSLGPGEWPLETPGAAQKFVVSLPVDAAEKTSLTWTNSDGDALRLGWDGALHTLTLDRSGVASSSFDDFFNQPQTADLSQLLDARRSLEIAVYIDRCSIEVFALDGRVVMSSQVFPEQPFDRIKLDGHRDAELAAAVYSG